MNTVELNLDKHEFCPGDIISGRASWSLSKAPKNIEVRLFWYTRGKGDDDTETVKIMKEPNPFTQGGMNFKIKTPIGPYSFSGKLISLMWALELIVEPSGECQREEIIISPIKKEILL